MTAAARLSRKVMRFSRGTIARLERIAREASRALRFNVSVSAVARAAITTWLDAAEQGDPADTFAEISTAIVKRGRKRATITSPASSSAGALAAEEPAPAPLRGPP